MRVEDRRSCLSVFVLAFALRLAVLIQLGDVPLFRTPQLDSLEYLEWATRIASGDFSWPDTPIHGPGYPLFLGAALAVTRSLFGARVIQALAGAGTAVLVFLIADLVERRRPGGVLPLFSGLLAAAYGPLVLMDVSIYGEGLLVFLLTLAAYIALRAGRFHHVLAGLAFGFAVIVRPTSLVLAPLFLLAMRTRRAIILFALFAAYPIVPVIFHNWTTSGDVVAVQASGGMNFLIGNSPKHDGTAWARPGAEWDRLRGAAWRAGVRGAGDEDRFYLARAFDEIRASPFRYVRLIGLKLLWLIQADEIRDSHSFTFFADRSALLRWLPGFGVLFALFVFSVTLWLKDHHRVIENTEWFLSGWIVLMGGAVLMLVIGYRYRLPIVPPMLVFAGAGLAGMRRARWLVLIAVIAFAATHIRRHEPTHELSEEWAMSALALRKEGNVPEARETARHAIALNPKNSLTWLTLGDIEASRDDWAAAEQAWLRAIEVDPDTSRAWSHLALARIRRGDMRGAEVALVRALSIRRDMEALENLARLRSLR